MRTDEFVDLVVRETDRRLRAGGSLGEYKDFLRVLFRDLRIEAYKNGYVDGMNAGASGADSVRSGLTDGPEVG